MDQNLEQWDLGKNTIFFRNPSLRCEFGQFTLHTCLVFGWTCPTNQHIQSNDLLDIEIIIARRRKQRCAEPELHPSSSSSDLGVPVLFWLTIWMQFFIFWTTWRDNYRHFKQIRIGNMGISPGTLQVSWQGPKAEFSHCWLLLQIQSEVFLHRCWTLYEQLQHYCRI